MSPVNDDNRPVLIAYDGSDFSKAAIAEAAGQLAPGRKAVVLTEVAPESHGQWRSHQRDLDG